MISSRCYMLPKHLLWQNKRVVLMFVNTFPSCLQVSANKLGPCQTYTLPLIPPEPFHHCNCHPPCVCRLLPES